MAGEGKGDFLKLAVEGEGKKILESYGASLSPRSPLGPIPSSFSMQKRRHSDPIILKSSEEFGSDEKDWPIFFGGTPSEEETLPPSRPRSRTVQVLPDGTLPPVREKARAPMTIGQKKTKLPARRLSLPPILEADHQNETLSPVSKKASPTSHSQQTPQSTPYSKYFRWGKRS